MFSFVSTFMYTCGKRWASPPIVLYFKENIYFMYMCVCMCTGCTYEPVFRRGSWIPEVTGSYAVLGTEPGSSCRRRKCSYLHGAISPDFHLPFWCWAFALNLKLSVVARLMGQRALGPLLYSLPVLGWQVSELPDIYVGARDAHVGPQPWMTSTLSTGPSPQSYPPWFLTASICQKCTKAGVRRRLFLVLFLFFYKGAITLEGDS